MIIACNAIVGNDGVSLWPGVDGPDGALGSSEAGSPMDSSPSSSSSGSPSGSSSGGSSGSSASSGSSSSEGGTPLCLDGGCFQCTPGATECTSDTQMETCGTNGQWGSAATCPSACVEGEGGLGGNCDVMCIPTSTQCSGSAAQKCGPDGQWANAQACSGTTPFCANGACAIHPPSCPTSGAGSPGCGTSAESCCASLEVAGGSNHRTYTNSGDGGTEEADTASVSGFRLDEYLVTVGRFRAFVEGVLPGAGGTGWRPPEGSGKHTHLNGGRGLANSGSSGTFETGWLGSDDGNIAPTTANLSCLAGYSTWTSSASGQESLPINCANWYEAYAFCIWDGGFLPSEAEWEYAAAAGSQQREYPWGATDPGAGNNYAIFGDGSGDCLYPNATYAACTGVANIAPVGTAPLGAGLWGQLDLAGEVFEWNADGYANYVNPCVDGAYLAEAPTRVIRGGFYGSPSVVLESSYRYHEAATTRDPGVGFRCARTP
jgi:formylglycine-generating enzyme